MLLSWAQRCGAEVRPRGRTRFGAAQCRRLAVHSITRLWSHKPWTAQFKLLLWLSLTLNAMVTIWISRFVVHETKTHHVVPPLDTLQESQHTCTFLEIFLIVSRSLKEFDHISRRWLQKSRETEFLKGFFFAKKGVTLRNVPRPALNKCWLSESFNFSNGISIYVA